MRLDTGRSGLFRDSAGSLRTDGKMVKQSEPWRQPRQNIYRGFPTRLPPMTSSGSISVRRVDFDRGVGRSSQRSVRSFGMSFIVARDRENRFANRLGSRCRSIHKGDCVATMLSLAGPSHPYAIRHKT